MKKIKKIGIVSWKTDSKSFGITIPYLRFISNFGIAKLILPTDVNTFNPEDYDLIILPGGPDIDPQRYDQIPSFDTGNPCIFREFFDNNMLRSALDAGTRIFGICRGMQTLNVIFGGSLDQNININKHGINPTDDRIKDVHPIVFYEQLMLNKEFYTAGNTFKVNSIHHQSVTINTLAEEFLPVAVHESCTDHIEIMIHKYLPIIGVQYHPEELKDNLSISLVNLLLNTSIYESHSIKNVAEVY